MSASLLWINKGLDSVQLSQSSKPEDSVIRRHVQTTEKSDARLSTQAKDDQTTTARLSFDPTSTSWCIRSIFEPLEQLYVQLTADESRGMHYFISRTSKECSGWQDSSLWNSIALQACRLNTGVAHALVSLAAIHESSNSALTSDHQARLQLLARQQLAKSLHYVRREQSSYSVALLSCIVLICVQQTHSSNQAYRLIRSGEALLAELDAAPSRSSVPMSKSERTMIESELRPLLDRLHARICSIGDAAQALVISARQNVNGIHGYNIPVIPRDFQSIREARDSLEKIFKWGHDFVEEGSSTISKSKSFNQSLRQLLSSWRSALTYAAIGNPTGNQEISQRSKKLLDASAWFGQILLETFNATTESVYDDKIVEFGNIMDIVRDIEALGAWKGTRSFGIDCGLIDIVAFVGNKCRDPVIRRRAMRYLVNSHRVEGDRWSDFGGRILETIIQLEESGQHVESCRDVPEENRRRLLYGYKYYHQMKILLTFARSPYDLAAGAETEEVWLPLRRKVCNGASEVLLGGDKSSLPIDSFGRGYAAYLESEASKQYHTFYLKKYYFPIPRV